MALAASVTSWQGFVARIDESKQKIENLQQSISQLEQRLQQQIVANVQSDLQKQELKLTHYLAEARLALARLYDDHYSKKSSPPVSEVSYETLFVNCYFNN